MNRTIEESTSQTEPPYALRLEPINDRGRTKHRRAESISSHTGTDSSSENNSVSLPPVMCHNVPSCPGHASFCTHCFLNTLSPKVLQPIPCKCPKSCPGYTRSKSCERPKGTGEVGSAPGVEGLSVSHGRDSHRQATPDSQKRSLSQPPCSKVSNIAIPRFSPRVMSTLEAFALGYQWSRGWERENRPPEVSRPFTSKVHLAYCPDCNDILGFENLDLEDVIRLNDSKGSIPTPCNSCVSTRRQRMKIKAELIEGYDELVKKIR